MDVIPVIRKAVELAKPKDAPVPGKPWSDDLAALTDADPGVHGPAMGRLVRAGAQVLADLGVLAQDRNWEVRARVARVAAGIGGEAGGPLCLRLTKDADARVRRMAIVGLGRCRGEEVYARAAELLAASDPDEREAAAGSLSALGDVRALAPLARHPGEADGVARPAMARALADLCRLPAAAPAAEGLLGSLPAPERRALLEALLGSADTRLCPVLARLVDDREALTSILAVRVLGTAGDARAIAALVRLATSERLGELREAAAETLRALTGYRAGPGQAWVLWWRDHQAETARLAERDALLAACNDPAHAVAASELARFAPAELMPLAEAAIESGRARPAWYAARALAALRRDDPARWPEALERRHENEDDTATRLGLLILLDELGAPRDALDRILRRLEAEAEEARKAWKGGGPVPPDRSGERVVLRLALARRAGRP